MMSFARISKWTIGERLGALTLIAVIGPLALVPLVYRVISTVKVGGPLYVEIVRGKDLVADILPPPEYIIETYLVAYQAAEEPRPDARKQYLARLKQLKADYDTRHDYWAANLPEGDMKRTLLVESYEPAQRFYATLERDFVPAVEAGNLTRAAEIVKGPLLEAYEQHRVAIDRLVVKANEFSNDAEARSRKPSTAEKSVERWRSADRHSSSAAPRCASPPVGTSPAASRRAPPFAWWLPNSTASSVCMKWS
ncbi:MAG: hypothetical protein ABUS56_00455 [Acidobacteriota bacterium]